MNNLTSHWSSDAVHIPVNQVKHGFVANLFRYLHAYAKKYPNRAQLDTVLQKQRVQFLPRRRSVDQNSVDLKAMKKNRILTTRSGSCLSRCKTKVFLSVLRSSGGDLSSFAE